MAEFFGKVVNLAFFSNATGMAREKRPFEMEGAREGVENEKRPRSGLARFVRLNKFTISSLIQILSFI